MILAVLDTNVLVSAIVAGRTESAPGQLLRRWRVGAFRLVVSDPILVELERTLGNAYFRQRLSRGAIDVSIDLIRTTAVMTPLTVAVSGVASHPEDDLILATVLSARADLLVTGDRRLQQRAAEADVEALAPRDFLDLLDRTGD